MNSGKRITRKQAKDDSVLQGEVDAFYTEPFTSTPIPRSKSEEALVSLEGKPKVLFPEDEPPEPLDYSVIFSESGNQTVESDQTLRFQVLSEDSHSSAGESDDKNASFKNPAELSDLFKTEDHKSEHSSISSNSSIKDEKMATKQTISLKDALRVIPEFNGSNILLSQFLEGCDIAKEMIEEGDEKTFVKLTSKIEKYV